jgi:hypothetical protein
MEIVRINVDFNNCDREGRVRLTTVGAIQSLNESQITLRNGLEVELTSGDLYPRIAATNEAARKVEREKIVLAAMPELR